jgi:hypothetical protein
VFSSLDLNPYLGNINGFLQLGSGYMETCTSEGGVQQQVSYFIFADCWRADGILVATSFDVNNYVANINGQLQWQNCKLLAMDEIAAADEDVALSGRKLLNH